MPREDGLPTEAEIERHRVASAERAIAEAEAKEIADRLSGVLPTEGDDYPAWLLEATRQAIPPADDIDTMDARLVLDAINAALKAHVNESK